jgi:hypothetical protein
MKGASGRWAWPPRAPRPAGLGRVARLAACRPLSVVCRCGCGKGRRAPSPASALCLCRGKIGGGRENVLGLGFLAPAAFLFRPWMILAVRSPGRSRSRRSSSRAGGSFWAASESGLRPRLLTVQCFLGRRLSVFFYVFQCTFMLIPHVLCTVINRK